MTTKMITAKTPETLARTLGLTGVEAQEWQVQHVLLKRLQQIVRDGALTHAEIARRGRSSRTRVTSILNGNLDNVSSDLLIRLLSALGYRVKVSVSSRLGGLTRMPVTSPSGATTPHICIAPPPPSTPTTTRPAAPRSCSVQTRGRPAKTPPPLPRS